ncbi:MAG: type IV pilus twitching motility protein PilT [Candidatus Edwardsbacteria bacterium]|jgi:twitching motility protein PilT|nr:type IV pilus twitching motility protein PilT [Candidatus Edwardsbacteria bacterium]
MPKIDELLRTLVAQEGSDLHIKSDEPPVYRIHGQLVRSGMPVLSAADTRDLLYEVLNDERRERFERTHQLDMSYSIPGVSRFRVNVFRQKNAVGAVLRVIPLNIKTIDELGLPQVMKKVCMLPRGLILVTGPTGSGKSTSLAAMIDLINDNKSCHIITIEDPIEFLHRDKRACVNQREVGIDTHSFAAALKHVMRQNPDIIMVGEMRDLETIQLAITAAETGHLVMATLHTADAAQTVDRIIDVFPPGQQQQVRLQLSTTLQAVFSQALLPRADGKGRVVAYEVMTCNPALRSIIREGKTHQIYSNLQSGAKYGMITLDACLKDQYLKGIVNLDDAVAKSSNPHEFEKLVGKG